MKLKKSLIIKAASEVIARNGVDRTRIEDISKTANISKGIIYDHFIGKEEIVTEVFHQNGERFFSKIKKGISKSYSSQQNLKNIFQMIEKTLLHESLMSTLLYTHIIELTKNKNPEFRKMSDNYYNNFKTLLKELIDEGIKKEEINVKNAEFLSSVVLSTIDGLILQYIFNLKNYQENVSKILNGLYKYFFDTTKKEIKNVQKK